MVSQPILSINQMHQLEQQADLRGHSFAVMMEMAGQAVADHVLARFRRQPVYVLAGPGNNGGDALVCAVKLRQHGWPVQIFMPFAPTTELTRYWAGQCGAYQTELDLENLAPYPLIIDGIYGTGLSRPVEGRLDRLFQQINMLGLPVVAIDIASGIHADTGKVMGNALKALHTVTFAACKLGHVLNEGKHYSGQIFVADIGLINDDYAGCENQAKSQYHYNQPEMWLSLFPWPTVSSHKYSRGMVSIYGTNVMPGAVILAAHACRRVGAGMVHLYGATPSDMQTVLMNQPGVVCHARNTWDHRTTIVLAGCGVDVSTDTASDYLYDIVQAEIPIVLDGGALRHLAQNTSLQEQLVKRNQPTILTPHAGELARFGVDHAGAVNQLQDLAQKLNIYLVAKGNTTLIVGPDRQVIVNQMGTPFLATSGTGDVLAGMIAGLLAQGMPVMSALSAAVWLHGAAAHRCGPGLIAEDLSLALPQILNDLFAVTGNRY